jgi:hypothetical protein
VIGCAVLAFTLPLASVVVPALGAAVWAGRRRINSRTAHAIAGKRLNVVVEPFSLSGAFRVR